MKDIRALLQAALLLALVAVGITQAVAQPVKATTATAMVPEGEPVKETTATVLVPEGEPALLQQGQPATAFRPTAGGVPSVSFSPDGKLLATSSSDHAARLWRLGPDGQYAPLAELNRHSGSVNSVSFSPDGKLLATGSSDNTARLWHLGPDGQPAPLAELNGHSGSVNSVSFSPDGKLLATGSSDNTARLWRLGPDGQPAPLAEFKGHAGSVNSVSFSPAGKLLATGSVDTTARLWRIGPDGVGAPLGELKGHTNSVSSVAFSPDGRLLATGSFDYTARLWRIGPDGLALPLGEPKEHTNSVSSVAFNPDGKLLATGSRNGTVRLWRMNPEAPAPLVELPGLSSSVQSLVFRSDGKILATGSEDATARLWRLGISGQAQPIASNVMRTRVVHALAYSSDGRLLAMSPSSNVLNLWSLKDDSPPVIMSVIKTSMEEITSVSFCEDQAHIAFASDRGSAQVWDISLYDQPRMVAALQHSAFDAVDISCGLQGNYIALISAHGNLHQWFTGQNWATDYSYISLGGPHGSGPANAVCICKSGEVLTASANNIVLRWEKNDKYNARLIERNAGTILDGHECSVGGPCLVRAIRDYFPEQWTMNPILDNRSNANLLKDAHSFSAVGVSVGNKQLATTSHDGRISLWQEKKRVGQLWSLGEGWVSQWGDRMLRHDPGGLLLNQDADGRLHVVPPPRPSPEPQLSLEILPEVQPAEDAGRAGRFVVRVRNAAAAGRAYWLRLSGVDLPEGVAVQAERTHLRLEPGKFTDIPLSVYVLSGRMDRHDRPDDDQPTPQPRTLPITLSLSHAFGSGPSLGAMLDWRAPQLVGEFKLTGDRGAASIEVRVRNDGNQDPNRIEAEAVFIDAQGREVPVVGRQQFNAGSLAPGKSVTFSLPVPDSLRGWRRFYTQPLRVKLRIRDGLWYTHLWQPESGPLKPVAPVWSLAALAALMSLLGVGLRLYLDPVVRATARDGEALRRFALSSLPRVSGALLRVRRLESALDAAGLKRAQWDRALHATETPRAAAQALADALGATLGAEVESGCPAFAITLPPLALRFAQHAVVCVVTGRDLDPGRAATLARQLHQEGRGSSVVLLIDLTERKNAKDALRDAPHLSLVALPADAFRDLLLSDSPTRSLEAALVEQRPVVTLSPYVGGGGVTESSMFFGRAAELRQIADERPHNVLLVGPRQMGKSTLLHALERRIRARGDLDVQHHTLVSDDILSFLASKLGRLRPTSEAELYALLAGEKSRPRMWLLDEADGLVRADRELDHMLSRTLRALADDGRAFFVLAGFWQLYAAVALDPNSPLRNFGRTLRLGPLDRDAARELATKPMAALRLTYDATATVDYLLDQTGCRANLVAVACSGLVESLDPTARSLTRAHVEAVLKRDKGVRDALSFWRGSGGLDGQRTDGLPAWARALDRALLRTALLCTAAGPRPSRSDLRARLDAAGLRPSGDAFQQSLDRVELSYLLIPDERDRYFCPIPLIQSVIEREQPLIEGLAEDVEDYEGAVRRAG